MRTISARFVTCLHEEHIFEIDFPIHGGDQSLSHPWGAPNHLLPKSVNVPMATATAYRIQEEVEPKSELSPDENAEVGK
jgi:hypothetical protein